jgi:hypothetical protein
LVLRRCVIGTSGLTDIVSGLVGLVFFGWFAVRPNGVARSQMEWHARVWGRLLKGWPEVARIFGLLLEDGEPHFAERVERDWSRFVRFIGISGVVIAVFLIAQGIGKLA